MTSSNAKRTQDWRPSAGPQPGVIDAEVQELLQTHMMPHLDPAAVALLKCVCRTLRQLVDTATDQTWQQLAAKHLPPQAVPKSSQALWELMKGYAATKRKLSKRQISGGSRVIHSGGRIDLEACRERVVYSPDGELLLWVSHGDIVVHDSGTGRTAQLSAWADDDDDGPGKVQGSRQKDFDYGWVDDSRVVRVVYAPRQSNGLCVKTFSVLDSGLVAEAVLDIPTPGWSCLELCISPKCLQIWAYGDAGDDVVPMHLLADTGQVVENSNLSEKPFWTADEACVAAVHAQDGERIISICNRAGEAQVGLPNTGETVEIAWCGQVLLCTIYNKATHYTAEGDVIRKCRSRYNSLSLDGRYRARLKGSSWTLKKQPIKGSCWTLKKRPIKELKQVVSTLDVATLKGSQLAWSNDAAFVAAWNLETIRVYACQTGEELYSQDIDEDLDTLREEYHEEQMPSAAVPAIQARSVTWSPHGCSLAIAGEGECR